MQEDALRMLERTSRTFFIPVCRLPGDLRAAVMAAYLCLRAIDQVEDHPELDNPTKATILRDVSRIMQSNFEPESFIASFAPYRPALEEVTVRIGEWALLAPAGIAPRVWEATATMAERMANWAESGWTIRTETDLDRYTFGVAGSVGLLLSDLWAWYDDTRTDRMQAVGFGRGLQTVNILRNRAEDLERGVDFFPAGWSVDDVHAYARRQLALADAYTEALPRGPVYEFCVIPLALAHATLDSLARGDSKLSRSVVLQIIDQVLQSSDAREGTPGS